MEGSRLLHENYLLNVIPVIEVILPKFFLNSNLLLLLHMLLQVTEVTVHHVDFRWLLFQMEEFCASDWIEMRLLMLLYLQHLVLGETDLGHIFTFFMLVGFVLSDGL